ncbi:class I SAM-dependent methyltransferase [Terasakiella sp. A23]|uniref:class I SAM-dependent methyltransferase n=1 Tax=Terasakiella sp. FCG-A23 TaxID=3080561 RepID=UPI002952CBEC|nr:class I SAM-dependent methyltransferase [Terasakiella sp. A23]MDV7340793.1 class I SAM-dependent methyltransferase [Terasakiella sp. A23]
MHTRYTFPCQQTHFPMSEHSLKQRDEFEQKRNEMIKLNCLVCDHTDFEEIGQVDRYGFYYPTGICTKCGNVQQIKYYDDESLALFYSSYFRDVYSDQTPIECFDGQVVKGRNILEFSKEFLPKDARILEIGTGAGGIPKIFQDEAGYTALGLDFDDRYIEYGRSQGVDIRKGGIEMIKEDEKFNLVIVSHVLEHIVTPSKFLQDIKKILKPKGYIYIEIPSLNSVSQGAYNFDFLNYFQNSHVNHYSVDSFKRLLHQNGLKAVKNDDFIRSICMVSDARVRVIPPFLGGFRSRQLCSPLD